MQTIRRLSLPTLLAAAILASGCALFKPKTEPVEAPTQVQQLKEIERVITVSESVIDSVAAVQRGEDQLYDLRKADGGRFITPAQHGAAADVFTAFAAEVKPHLEVVKDLAAEPQTRVTAAEKIISAAQDTLARLLHLSPGTKGYVETAVGLIKALVLPRL